MEQEFRKLPPTDPQLFVVTVGMRGCPEEHAPSWRRIRDGALDRIDFDALAALLPR